MPAEDPKLHPRLPPASEAATLPPDNPPASEASTLPPASGDPDGTLPQTAPPPWRLGYPEIPGYEILSELGRGGMGVVYKARDVKLNRTVALKMVLSGSHADPKEIVRFLTEAEAVAAIEHPHVVRVFGYGEHEGRPFMALEFCAGGSLAGLIRPSPERERGGLPPAEAAALVEKIARGVQAAHDLGIVHRDLKPGNVLLSPGEPGASAPGFLPKVTDFGLARRGEGSGLTQTNAVMGTPEYMAPEQARGQTRFVGPAADIYALGGILYACLAGRPPFQGDDPVSVLMKQVEEDPPPLSKFVPGVPRDLELICRKCLAKEPHERYPTAAALADDLARFQRGEAVTVRPAGRLERLARWARRKPTLAAAYSLTAVSLLLAGLVAGAVWLWQQAEGARGEAETAKGEAETQRDAADKARSGEADARQEVERVLEKLARVNYGRTIQVAYQNWRDNKIAEARTLLAGTRADLRGWEYDHVHRLCHADLITLDGNSPMFSLDGTQVLTVTDHRTVRVWEVASGKSLAELKGHTDSVNSAVFSPDGSRILTASSDNTARIWDAVSGRPLAELKHTDPVRSASFSPDGSRVLTTTGSTACVWDAASGRLLAELKGHTDSVTSGVFSPDGSRVLTRDLDNQVRIWEASSSKPLAELKGHTGPVFSVVFSADGSRVLTGSSDRTARVWEASSGKPLAELKGRTGSVSSAVFSPDGSRVLTAGSSSARIWEASSGKPLAELKDHTGIVGAAVFSPDGSRVLIASGSSARIWETSSGKPLAELKGHTNTVRSASFSPDGSRVLTAGRDGTVRLWDTESGAEVLALPGTHFASFSPDGSRIVTGGPENTAVIYDSRPVNRAFLRFPVAPMPRAVGK